MLPGFEHDFFSLPLPSPPRLLRRVGDPVRMQARRRSVARTVKGIEPDQCSDIRNEARIRGKTEVDLNQDPPPDLAIQIYITRSSLDSLGIYAALGVPEVWRFDADKLLGLRTFDPTKHTPWPRRA